MRRREFITLVGSAAAWPLAVHAQQQLSQAKKMPRLGMLMPGVSAHSGTILEPFYRGLHELGYVEGQNIAIERRYGDSIAEKLPDLAAELVKLKVDIIVAWSTPAAIAAKQATNTIPIVAAVMADPVGDGLVASLARPGGNITGTTFVGPELVSKRLQLLKEIIPRTLASGCPLASPCVQRAHDGKHVEGDRNCGSDFGNAASIRAGR